MTATAQSPAAKPTAPIERTEHPHVVKSADTLGGEPRVEWTRIPVRQIAALFAAGTTVEEIVRSYPPLTPAQIHDAISYALDHPVEMAYNEERHSLKSVMRRHNLIFVDKTHRLIPRERFQPEDVPLGATAYTWDTLPEDFR